VSQPTWRRNRLEPETTLSMATAISCHSALRL
jgi:hypothetical protein